MGISSRAAAGSSSGQELVFPLEWRGRVVTVADQPEVVGKIQEFLRAYGVDAPPHRGNVSRQGTYVTYIVEVTLPDQAMMIQVMHGLAALPGVKTVL